MIEFDTIIISRSPAHTEKLAAGFYEIVGNSGVIALYGPLGAGKTVFVRGFAAAAGVDPDKVNSPSFTLVNEYPGGQTPIFHFDLYRFKKASEFHDIGGDDYLSREGIALIEWAENGVGFIPENRFEIEIDIIDETSRSLIFRKIEK
ncbi:MAG: tRNA (adenosine(37)-N6)-threonylcarbamoyltransferase complex ATPase subunit type 1 TsaE [candidate division Zixibacteria bacterium]